MFFSQHRLTWTRKYCAFEFGQGELLCWVAERKRSWPGRWAVGCALCNNLMRHAFNAPDDTAFAGTRITCLWARFEQESPTASNLNNHAKSLHHRTALKFFLNPGAGLALPGSAVAPDTGTMPAIISCPHDGSKGITKECPFGPGVPQPADYLRVWEHILTRVSGRSTQKHHAQHGSARPSTHKHQFQQQ